MSDTQFGKTSDLIFAKLKFSHSACHIFHSGCQIIVTFSISVVKLYSDTKKASLRLAFKWCHVSESNQGHRDFQSLALPTELTWLIFSLNDTSARSLSITIIPIKNF